MKAPDKSFMFFFSGEKFNEEVKSLQEALTQHCDKEKKPIYEPTEFFKFCSQHGAANCFNFVLAYMTSSRHFEDRISLNRKLTVAILYQLCFGLSQKSNFLQEDNGLFLQFCNLSQTGIETQRLLGTSCSSKVLSRYRANIGKEHSTVVNDAIKNALENKHAILMMIDDYHNIHTVRRPRERTHTCKVDHMATIIIKIVKEASAIPFSSVNLIHKPSGIDPDLLVNNLCYNHFFGQVSSSLFASSMPE